MQASRAGTISVVSDQAPKISRRLRVKLFHAISKNLYGCAWDFRSFSQEGYNTIKFFNQNVKPLLPTGYYPHLVWLKPFFLRRLSFHKYHSIYLIRRFGVLYRGVFLRVELYFDESAGWVKIQTTIFTIIYLYASFRRREKRSKQRGGLWQVLRNARVGLAYETSTCHIGCQNDSKLNLFSNRAHLKVLQVQKCSFFNE